MPCVDMRPDSSKQKIIKSLSWNKEFAISFTYQGDTKLIISQIYTGTQDVLCIAYWASETNHKLPFSNAIECHIHNSRRTFTGVHFTTKQPPDRVYNFNAILACGAYLATKLEASPPRICVVVLQIFLCTPQRNYSSIMGKLIVELIIRHNLLS
ncbi:hypothetical protein KL938_002894 [Ogataea parapolymorpha]|nr:hypothetical protein KL938_002894 [Ogataea parapolymorpha]